MEGKELIAMYKENFGIDIDPKRLDIACQITGSFEGTGQTNIAGNFDGQGISMGFLQWNLGQGTAQEKILGKYAYHYGKEKLDSFFPSPISEVLDLSKSESIQFAEKNILRGINEFKPGWKEAFKKFLSTDEVLELQKVAALEIARKAQSYCNEYKFDSIRAFCFFFDVVVQNGSMLNIKPSSIMDARARLCINFSEYTQDGWNSLKPSNESIVLANLIFVRARKNKWRKDVLSRKLTIAFGSGTVHGKFYNFEKVFKEDSND